MKPISCQFSSVILYVQNMENEVHFYRDILGFPVRFPKDVSSYADQMWVEMDSGACILGLHAGETEKPDDKHELVFTVNDIQTARKTLMEAGLPVSDIRMLEDGHPILSSFDPDGHGISMRE